MWRIEGRPHSNEQLERHLKRISVERKTTTTKTKNIRQKKTVHFTLKLSKANSWISNFFTCLHFFVQFRFNKYYILYSMVIRLFTLISFRAQHNKYGQTYEKKSLFCLKMSFCILFYFTFTSNSCIILFTTIGSALFSTIIFLFVYFFFFKSYVCHKI